MQGEVPSTLPATRPPSAVLPWTGFLDLVLACFPTGGVFTDALVILFVCAPRPVGFCRPFSSCACFFPPCPLLPPSPFVSGSCKWFFFLTRLLARDVPMPRHAPGWSLHVVVAGFFSAFLPSSVKVSTAQRRVWAVFAVPWPRRVCWVALRCLPAPY